MVSSETSLSLKHYLRKHSRIVNIVLLSILIGTLWVYYLLIGSPKFNKENAVSIYGTVIQGMSALLSVSIAVIVFRIQSLENRNQLLEESTLNFIFQTTRLAYPKWIPSVEEDIRSRAISKKYYEIRARSFQLGQIGYSKKVKEFHADENTQQKRLEETLNLHTRTEQTIQRTKNNVFLSMIFLIFPILVSFFLLMISDALEVSTSFYNVSLVVLMSAFGIVSLIMTVLESTVQKDELQENITLKPEVTKEQEESKESY
jgi:hypothetical protein